MLTKAEAEQMEKRMRDHYHVHEGISTFDLEKVIAEFTETETEYLIRCLCCDWKGTTKTADKTQDGKLWQCPECWNIIGEIE